MGDFNIQGSKTIKRRAKDGRSPFVGENKNWWVWDADHDKYIDSGDSAIGDDGRSPYISGGYWWAWDGEKWYNTWVKANGEDGVGIQSTKRFYLATSEGSGVTHYTQGWRTDPTEAVLTKVNRYLWYYESITYTDGSYTNTIPAIIGVYGNDGANGLPGQIPIQKEWVVGDTHHNTDEIVDHIYVRGVNKEQSYWYKLIEKGTVRAVTPPTGGATPSGYKRITWMEELSVKVLIVEEANIAGLILKDEELISQRGTVNGIPEDYSGQLNFIPNIIINAKEGDVKITGIINAKDGVIEKLTMAPNGVIELPPTFNSPIKGSITSDGINLVFERYGESQRIEWSYLLGTASGRIKPIYDGSLEIYSDFGLTLQSQRINIAPVGWNEINIGNGLSVVDFKGSSLKDIKEITRIGFTTMESYSISIPNNIAMTIQHDTALTIITGVGTNSYIKSIYMNSNNLLREGAIKWILNRSASAIGMMRDGNIRVESAQDIDWVIKGYSLAIFVYSAGYWYKHNDHR